MKKSVFILKLILQSLATNEDKREKKNQFLLNFLAVLVKLDILKKVRGYKLK